MNICLIEPELWTIEHVQGWLRWARHEYSLQDLDLSRWPPLTGRQLCRLGREDLIRLTTPYTADVLISLS